MDKKNQPVAVPMGTIDPFENVTIDEAALSPIQKRGIDLQKKAAVRHARSSRTAPPVAYTPPPAAVVVELPIQLPLWPAATCGAPNAILRSSLFGVVKSGRRKKLFNEQVISPADTTINFTGEELNQNDLDLWLMILNMSQESGGLGVNIGFSAKGALKHLGKAGGGSGVEWIKNTIKRLKQASVHIETPRYIYGLGLIDVYKVDKETGDITVSINKQAAEMFGTGLWTQIEIKDRLNLKSQLAQWLHSFYLSHANPYHYSIELIKKLSGSTASTKGFMQMLKAAILELEGLGWSMTITENKLIVKVPASKFKKAKSLPKPKAKKITSDVEQARRNRAYGTT